MTSLLKFILYHWQAIAADKSNPKPAASKKKPAASTAKALKPTETQLPAKRKRRPVDDEAETTEESEIELDARGKRKNKKQPWESGDDDSSGEGDREFLNSFIISPS